MRPGINIMKHFYTKKERIVIAILVLILAWSSYSIVHKYILSNADVIPAKGGIYTEGMVGKPMLLNPLFSYRNPVDRDISLLIFDGLTKFDPQSGTIQDNLAVSKRSDDNRMYTFTLLPNLKWHDGHPVTSEDIIFTYQTIIQSDAFKNHFLYDTFSNIKITKIDNRTVAFTLREPYSFFRSNVTTGLLPKHILESVPPENLNTTEFNQAPIGTGPYVFKSWIHNGDTAEITLTGNSEYFSRAPKIETLIFRVFLTQEKMDLSENTLNGRKVTAQKAKEMEHDGRFTIYSYQLPQYVALFLNTESNFLKNKKTRFGLLLATDKESIAAELGKVTVVDTPVLESKTGLDIEYNESRAKGAFYDTEWFLPSTLPQTTSPNENTDTQTTQASQKQKLIFTLSAESDSWITPQVDEKKMEGFILKKGERKTYETENELTLISIGNAGGVTLSINGINMKKLGGNGDVIKNLTLNKETVLSYLGEDEKTAFLESIGEKAPETTTKAPEEELPKQEEQSERESIRVNKKGERLALTLITAQNPPEYLKTAEIIQKQWGNAGVKLIVETYPVIDLQKKIQERDYDILLFGQNLGYNLDAYPFWHSSQAENGFNLSQHKNSSTDSLLVAIRETFDETKKQELLDKLKKNIAEFTPAIFLYNPPQYVTIDSKVKNIHLTKLATDSDRFTDIVNWYIKEDYKLPSGFSISKLFSWIWSAQ